MWDRIIIGAGLYGATIARLAHDMGERVLVLERRSHVGGNCYDEKMNGILVHKYGAHIFHTNDEKVWKFINQFARFREYHHRVNAHYEGREYTLPFNLETIKEVYGLKYISLEIAQEILENEHKREYYPIPENLEQQAVDLVGRKIYDILIKGYTEKQWGKPATELPPEIIRRLPVRMNSSNGYFSDKYQGLPIGGYTKMVMRMLKGIEVKTNVDFLSSIDYWSSQTKKIVYTGTIDELLGYELGPLPYRSLRFETTTLPLTRYQSLPVINETSPYVPYTRTIEHKHFGKVKSSQNLTVITREYPIAWKIGLEAFYPINYAESNLLYNRYLQLLSLKDPKIEIGGRLGFYRYLDMDETIRLALAMETNRHE